MQLLVFALFVACVFAARYLSVEKPIANTYIVVLRKGSSSALVESLLTQNVTVIHRYEHALQGFSGVMDKITVQKLLASPAVEYVEEDQMMYATNMDVPCKQQKLTPSWGLPRVSAVEVVDGLKGDYKYGHAGEGVTAFIIDTGILVSHQDFQGRATFGFKAESTWSNTDKNGHGTHVASTVVGAKYGIAKLAHAVAVKVLGDNGSGSNAGVIKGVDYCNAQAQKPGKFTANLSLGGGFSQALNDAVDNLVDAGVPTAVAAGNDNRNCADYSPASAKKAVTVCATDIGQVSGSEADVRSVFSNYGSCVDVCAPGTLITGAWIPNVDSEITISGTSMASPHVCGVMATLLSSGVPANLVSDTLVGDAIGGKIDMECQNSVCNQTPNRLLHKACDSI